MHIDRVLDRIAVGRTLAEGHGIGITHDCVAAFGTSAATGV